MLRYTRREPDALTLKIHDSYLVGMLLLMFGTGFKVSETLRTEYDVTLSQIDYEVVARTSGRSQ